MTFVIIYVCVYVGDHMHNLNLYPLRWLFFKYCLNLSSKARNKPIEIGIAMPIEKKYI